MTPSQIQAKAELERRKRPKCVEVWYVDSDGKKVELAYRIERKPGEPFEQTYESDTWPK